MRGDAGIVADSVAHRAEIIGEWEKYAVGAADELADIFLGPNLIDRFAAMRAVLFTYLVEWFANQRDQVLLFSANEHDIDMLVLPKHLSKNP